MGDYQLYYWPAIPGRGEFPRLVLEAAGAKYVDVVRLPEQRGGGVRAMQPFFDGARREGRPFAPPFLVKDGELVWQSMLCADFVARREALVPADAGSRDRALALSLTLADLVDEAHDTHHPIGVSLYYEQQKPEAARRSELFRRERLPKFLGYFEGVLAAGVAAPAPRLLGGALSYPDLMLFHVLEGLDYAFPQAMHELTRNIPRCRALQAAVREVPNVAAYLASERRLPFNQHGLFRHYPELDPRES